MKAKHTEYLNTETLEIANGTQLKILLKNADTNGTQAIFEDTVQPNVGPPSHIHYKQDETFLFLEGEFDVEVDGKLYHMKPGDVAFVPKGSVHTWKNVGNTIGRLRYIFSPALNIEEMFQELHDRRLAGNFDEEAQQAMDQKYPEHEFVGPPL